MKWIGSRSPFWTIHRLCCCCCIIPHTKCVPSVLIKCLKYSFCKFIDFYNMIFLQSTQLFQTMYFQFTVLACSLTKKKKRHMSHCFFRAAARQKALFTSLKVLNVSERGLLAPPHVCVLSCNVFSSARAFQSRPNPWGKFNEVRMQDYVQLTDTTHSEPENLSEALLHKKSGWGLVG